MGGGWRSVSGEHSIPVWGHPQTWQPLLTHAFTLSGSPSLRSLSPTDLWDFGVGVGMGMWDAYRWSSRSLKGRKGPLLPC